MSNPKMSLPLACWLLWASVIIGILSPLIGHRMIHNVAKAFLYGSAFASSATLTIMSRSPYLDRLREKEELEAEFRRDALRQLNVADAVVNEIRTKSVQYHGVRMVLEGAEPEVRNQLIEEYGLDSLKSLPTYTPPPPPKDLGLQLLKVAGSGRTDEDALEHINSWAIFRDNNVTVVGNQGEGKTNAAFFALYCWIYKCQEEDKAIPTIYAFDIHYGMGRHEDYKSTWLGLPVVDEVPDAIMPCVFHGESSQIGDWIMPVRRLYNYRKKNKIGTANGAEPVIVVIDEMTSHLAELEAKRAEQVSNWLTQLATGAAKFNIWIWVITHDMTETNTKVKTAFYRQSHVIMGAASAQASHIVSACQKNIAKGSIELAGSRIRDPHRNPKVPPCFVTSLPTPDGTGVLETPQLSNRQMELEWEPVVVEGADDEIEEFDSRFEDAHGKDPDDIPDEQDDKTVDVPAEDITNKPDIPPGEKLADELVIWIKELGRTPTADEVKAHVLAELKWKDLSDVALKGILWHLQQRGIQIS